MLVVVPVRNFVCISLPFCVSVFIVVLFIEPVLDPDPVSVPVSLSIAVQVLFFCEHENIDVRNLFVCLFDFVICLLWIALGFRLL